MSATDLATVAICDGLRNSATPALFKLTHYPAVDLPPSNALEIPPRGNWFTRLATYAVIWHIGAHEQISSGHLQVQAHRRRRLENRGSLPWSGNSVHFW